MDVNSLKKLRDRLSQERSRALFLQQQEESRLEEARNDVEDAQRALDVLQTCAEAAQRLAHDRLANVVTRCLNAVFGHGVYEFSIEFEKKRGRTEARLSFSKHGRECDPMSASGGGIVDVASFALRVAALTLSKPPLRRVLCLDEPFRFVSRSYRPEVRKLLEALASEAGIQFLIVSHDEEFQIGDVVEL